MIPQTTPYSTYPPPPVIPYTAPVDTYNTPTVVPQPPIVSDNICNDIQIYMEDGTCVLCPPFTRAQNNNSNCAADVCASGTVTIEGLCMPGDDVPSPTAETP